MAVLEVTCLSDHRRFTAPHPGPVYALWLQRVGGFLHRVEGRECYVDRMGGVMLREGQDRQVAHPTGDMDLGTELRLPEELAMRLPVGHFMMTREFDRAHRNVLVACRRGIDDFELADRLYALLRLVPGVPGNLRGGAADRQRRHAVSHAAQALAADGLALGLDALAERVGYSPHHLSRVFRSVTGMTLTAYRNELRVRAVLEDLHAGETSLLVLAARYGFADQAHLTRVMRRHRDATPSEMRRLSRP
ncbi:helix-turn-helix domain-containing protein [Streptomyces bambusae]|uniref:helix-turn-helix domain-containing protein n=1 Tax=Streptomyces bambusae TaxID=1550616 RepID=UPI0035AB95B5